jgi:topoisomerase-4 subunit B
LLDNKEEATTVPVAEQNEMEETTDGVKMISLFDE